MLGEGAALELRRNRVRDPYGHVEEIRPPGGPVVGDGRLNQVARRGELIRMLEVVAVVRPPERLAIVRGHDAGN